MYLSYQRLSQNTRIFKKIIGLSLGDFKSVIDLVKNSFDEAFPNVGRKPKINTHEDRLILIFVYYRCYVTHEFIGYFVDLDNANICRLFSRIEPLIAGKIGIKKDRTLTEEALSILLTDVTEQPIQRPKNKKARKSYQLTSQKT